MPSTDTYITQKYCTYITHYSGDKMPQNYIGSSTVNRIHEGYHGSVQSKKYEEIWKSELKLHPELFQTTIISLHDTAKESLWKELQLHKMFDVVKSELFINMSFAQPKGYFGTVGNTSGSEYQSNLVKEGKHVFQGSYNNERLLSLGLHSSQDKGFKERQRNRNNDLVNQGKHYFQSEKSIENNRKMQKELVENGTHWLLSGDIQRESAKHLLESGEHIMQIKCSCVHCKKETTYPNFHKYHGDNCKLSPQYSPIYHTCKYCGFKSTIKSVITSNHNDNCKLSPNYNPIYYTCTHCNYTTTSRLNYNRWHDNNCKHKPI